MVKAFKGLESDHIFMHSSTLHISKRDSVLGAKIRSLLSGRQSKISLFVILVLVCIGLAGCYPERVESIKLMNAGIKKHNSGSSTAAVRLLARSAETDPSNHRALFYRGLILNELGRIEERADRFEEAARALRDSVKINKEDPRVFYQLGVALSELERDNQALKAFADAQNIQAHGEAAYRSALIYLKQEQYNLAQESLRSAIIAQPELGLAYTALSQLYRRFKKPSAAVMVLKNAIENDPEDTNHYRDLGEVYASLKQYSKAIQLFETALQDRPTNAPLAFLLAEASYNHGDLQSAEIYIKKYLRMGHRKEEKLMISKAKRMLAKLRKK